jgi:hypothetical protein
VERQCAGPQQHGEVIRVLTEKLPLVCPWPPMIGSRMTGALITFIEHDGKQLTHVAR